MVDARGQEVTATAIEQHVWVAANASVHYVIGEGPRTKMVAVVIHDYEVPIQVLQ